MQWEMRFVPTDEGTFRLRPISGGVQTPMILDHFEMKFVDVNGTTTVGIRGPLMGPQWIPLGSRFEPAEANEAWSDRLGVWEPLNIEGDTLYLAEARITDEPGYLLIELDQILPGDESLRTLAASELGQDHAIIGGTSRSGGETIWIEHTDDGEVLHIAGTEFRWVSELPEGNGCNCTTSTRSGGPAWILALLGVLWILSSVRGRYRDHTRIFLREP